MFSLNRKLKDQNSRAVAKDSVARVAIAEDGAIIYANVSFHDLTGLPVQAETTNAFSLLQFASGKKDLTTIKTGLHKIKIKGSKTPVEFHFDWLTTPDNQRYLVGSAAHENSVENSDTLKLFESKILGQQQKSATLSKHRIETRDDFFNLSNLSDEIMLVVGDFGEIRRVNEKFLTFSGHDESELDSLDFIDLFHDEDKPYIRNTIQTLSLDSGAQDFPTTDFQARMLTKSGQTRWVEWRQRRSDNLMYCVGRDITGIKEQEEALSRRARQLSQAESIGRMGHWHWTIGAETIEWSDEIFRIFGVDRKNFRPTLDTLNKLVHRRDLARVNQAFQRAIIEENDYDMEFRILRPNGEMRYLRCEGRCAADPSGEITALYGIMQDMTERILYEQQLEEAKNAAERAYAAKSQFLANMSHELRTPLNAIIGFSEMMQRQLLGPIGTEKYLEYIQGIHESGEHLLDLISDILDMSKIEAGKYELDFEEVNVVKTIKVALHMMESRAMEAGVKLKADALLNEKLTIVADRRAFLQVMLNILSNATKFTKKGGSISVECIEKPDFIHIRIIDTGIGIPANKLASITRPFEQVSSHYAREHQGSGLGLAITKELVELHGGALTIDSTVGLGTTVTVRLPYDASKKLTR